MFWWVSRFFVKEKERKTKKRTKEEEIEKKKRKALWVRLREKFQRKSRAELERAKPGLHRV